MADPVWYYARGDVERGPFTLSQIRALANASKLRPDDLVWKEGMENWTAAREVTELFPAAGLVGDPSGSNGLGLPLDKGSGTSPFPTSTTPSVSAETRTVLYRVGRALACLGILLVFGTHGCESLGQRRVARLAADAELLQRQNPGEARQPMNEADRALQEYRSGAFTRGVAFQLGLLVLLAGGAGLMAFADRVERWLGVGLILLVVYALLETFTHGPG